MNDLRNSKVLITGGAGFVGSHIADRLIKEGVKQVVIVDNFIRGSKDNLKWAQKNGDVKVVYGDISDEMLINNLMQDIDYVFHESALRITQCAELPREAFKTLFEGTYNIAEAAAKMEVKKVVAASSASVYGEPNYLPIDECHPFNNYTFYGAGKIATEHFLRAFYDMCKLNYAALRYFNVYGPRMDAFGVYTEVMIKWLESITSGRPPVIHGDGSSSMDFIYIDDVVEANILAMKSDATDQVFNIGTGKETSLKELLSIMLKIIGSDLKPEFQPLRKINPVKRRCACTKKSSEALGFKAKVGLEEGMKKLVEWYKEIKRKE